MSKILLNYTKRSNSSQSSLSQIFANGNHSDEVNFIQANSQLNIYDAKKSPSLNTNSSKSSTSDGEKRRSDDTARNQIDESFVIEEPHEDCVYQITLKKVYKNKSSPPSAQNNEAHKPKVNPLGTYKLSSSGFYSYLYDDTNSAGNTGSNNSNDGLVYTRVKVKQLKYASLEKFIGIFSLLLYLWHHLNAGN